jgi:2Fe-2S ferredoxin
MAKIRYVDHTGAERLTDVPEGWSIMEGAVLNSIPGIDGDCGGCCACATCHVYVDPAWVEKLPPKDKPEIAMLELAKGVKANSRLGCQLKVSEHFDGLIVTTPQTQR